MSTKKHLILISSAFPYGVGESFLKADLDALKPYFKIIIIPYHSGKGIKRELPSGVELANYSIRKNISQRIWSFPFVLVRAIRKLSVLRKEFRSVSSLNHALSVSLLRTTVFEYIKGIENSYYLDAFLSKRYSEKDRVVLYSFWFNQPALMLVFSKFPFLKLSRAHGGDLYFERSPKNYLPFHLTKQTYLDGIFLISKQGEQYWKSKINANLSSIYLNKLVSPATGFQKMEIINRRLIVSCSSMIPLKRIHLIIQALAEIHTQEIEWIHFGSGPLKEELAKLAETYLASKSNISYEFKGQAQHKDILRFYQEQKPFMFVHTSASEGLPVSMMEAASFGMPILALDVGGVGEIVNAENGILLPKNSSPNQIADAILEMYNTPNNSMNLMRAASYDLWAKNHDPSKNHQDFIEIIKHLMNQKWAE